MRRFLVLLVGVIFLAVGIFILVKNNRLAKECTEKAVAKVVDMETEINTDTDSASPYYYYPVVEYEAGGKKVTVRMDSGSSTPEYNLGEEVKILYNPNNVEEFIVEGEKGSKIFSIVFIVLGGLVSLYGVKVAITGRP